MKAAALLLLAGAAAWLSSARRAASIEKRLIVTAWVADAVILVGSLGWYFGVALAAERLPMGKP